MPPVSYTHLDVYKRQFDSRHYVRQIGGGLPEGISALEHYLTNKHNWLSLIHI